MKYACIENAALNATSHAACEDAGLEQAVAQRTVELLEQVRCLERFSMQVAHDLRGAFGGIAGLADIALEALTARRDERAACQYLPVIAQQARRSADLLKALLQLACARDAALQPAQLDLQLLALQVVDELALASSACTLPQVQIEALPCVVADANLLHAALYNLVGNALKFTRGRVGGHVGIDASISERTVTVCVRDNGIGFDAAASGGQLFTPFARLHGNAFEGSGIGLSIVRHAVERHQGRVWAESAPGQGSRFYFTLPMAA